jgi:hypothetical protein
VIYWQELSVIAKKDVFLLFVSVNALLFSIQYKHAGFPYMLKLETIP